MTPTLVALTLPSGWPQGPAEAAAGVGPMMAPIILSSVALLGLAAERTRAFWPSRLSGRVARRVYRDLCGGQVPDPKVLRPLLRKDGSLLGRLLLVALDLSGRPVEEVRRSLEVAAGREVARLGGPNLWLNYLARIGPLLGLFASLSGICQNAALAGGVGSAPPAERVAGIAQSLMATLGGIVIALVAESMAHLFRRLVERYVVWLEDVLAPLPELIASWPPPADAG